MRSPADCDILQIDLTNACFLACSGCTRLCGHIAKPWYISVDSFRQAVRTLKPWWEPGKVIGLIGGEPTLHPEFDVIMAVFVEEFGDPTPLTNGRLPITDFADFAEERLFDRSNGRGLWTSLGPAYQKHAERIWEVFSHANINDHLHEGLHKSNLITHTELGLTEQESEEAIDWCWVQNTWSAAIDDAGLYVCEAMGPIAKQRGLTHLALPVTTESLYVTPDDPRFRAQRAICKNCALCLKDSPSAQANKEIDIVSPDWLKVLEANKSPAVRRGDVELYSPPDFSTIVDTETHHSGQKTQNSVAVVDGREHQKDRYMGDDAGHFRRVNHAENAWIKPKRLSLIVTCVGYSDVLAKTLPHNAGLKWGARLAFDDVVVVMDENGLIQWKRVAGYDGPLQFTYADPHKHNASFNKGAMLNAGLAALSGKPDWILFTDADCFLDEDAGRFIRETAWNPGMIYGTERIDVDDPSSSGISNGDTTTPDDEFLNTRQINGFFQLWNPRARSLRHLTWPNMMCEEFCSAGGIDSWFAQQYPDDKHCVIQGMPVRHIRHGGHGANWNGLAPKRGAWRHYGNLTWSDALAVLETPTPFAVGIKLTETRYGTSIEITPDVDVRQFIVDRDGTRWFCGRDIGKCHIHCAFRE